MNREQWLTKVAEEFCWPRILKAGGENNPYRVSVGFPHGRGNASKAIGQCWPTQSSAGKTHEIFISPVLGNGFEATHVLLHECIHASDGNKNGHKGLFRKLAKAVGLAGKMTATVPSEELALDIKLYLRSIEDYPHDKLSINSGGDPKPGSRLLKAVCEDCGYTIRTTQKWIDEVGLPTCACGGEFHQE